MRAQDRVTIQADGLSFDEFAQRIESNSSFRLFYRPEWVDTLRVTVSVVDGDLESVLQQVLRFTELTVTIDTDRSVYLAWRRSLSRNLPAGLLPGTGQEADEEDLTDMASFNRKERSQTREDVVHVIGKKSGNLKGEATITGTVRDARTGEPLVGVAVYMPEPLRGTTTDALGQYEVRLPKGRRILAFKSVGMKPVDHVLMIYQDGRHDTDLEEEITALKDVVVSAEREAVVQGVQLGRERMDIRSIRQMPMALGEADILKTVLTLPGVQTVGEGAGGLNVRGGASNQNLILFNGATVYNPSHLFGFFSTFNPDVVKGIDLYKSALEADKGGRLSSVLDVSAREGNLRKFTASGGISPITGRIALEGPIIKEKSSFLLAGRSTYSDWLLGRLDDKSFAKSQASFYDLNLTLSHQFDADNQLLLTAYRSQDRFRLKSDTLYRYTDQNAGLRWKHRFGGKNFLDVGTTASRYEFGMDGAENPQTAFRLRYALTHIQTRAGVSLVKGGHAIAAGIQGGYYKLEPGDFTPAGDQSLVTPEIQPTERGMEWAVYAGDQFDVTDRLSIYAGLRYSAFALTGERREFLYAAGEPVESIHRTDTVTRTGLSSVYHGPEPRLTARYLLDGNASLKFSIGRTRQYLQMLSNTTAIAPTDVWKLSDRYVRPQVADQLSGGWFSTRGGLEWSVEAYYKFIHLATDFQDGAVLFRNPHLETEIVNGKGKAYGLETMVRKPSGRLNGWISYTWSRSFLRTTSDFTVEQVNRNRYYRSNFDKPHAVNIISNYKFNRRVNLSFNLTYSTGRPITLPIARFGLGGGNQLQYSGRNALRIPDYFRADIAVNLEGSHRIRKFAHSSWTIGVYNLTGRRNAYSVFFRSEGQQVRGYKLSIFGQAIPTITWNFRI